MDSGVEASWEDAPDTKTSGKGPKKFKNQKKGVTVQVEGSSSRGTVQVVQVIKKQQPKKGKAARALVERRQRG